MTALKNTSVLESFFTFFEFASLCFLGIIYSTVTDLAKFLGWSIDSPRLYAT